MERILRGIMRYRVLDRASMVNQFQEVRDNPVVRKCISLTLFVVYCVLYICIDIL